MLPTSFTIRVYGLLIHNDQVLLSKENIKGNLITKFPGGGLEFGEGTLECLHREFKEEVDININVIHHHYTSEEFYQSSFHTPPKQVLCIYYLVSTNELGNIKSGIPEEAELLINNGDQVLFWQLIKELTSNQFVLETDKLAAEKLKNRT